MQVTEPAKDGKCRMLALRSGGTKSAFEIGALMAMLEKMKSIEVAYDVLVGVSMGGMNAGIFSTFPRGHELPAVEYLKEMWLD